MERDSKSQVYTVRQHGPLPWQQELCCNPKVPMLRGKDSNGKEKATTRTHSITEIQRRGGEGLGKVRGRKVYKRGQVQTRQR